MSKQSIAWHQGCYKSSSQYHAEEIERLERKLAERKIYQARDEFLRYQIESAIAEGKDGFDAEKYKKAYKEKFQ